MFRKGKKGESEDEKQTPDSAPSPQPAVLPEPEPELNPETIRLLQRRMSGGNWLDSLYKAAAADAKERASSQKTPLSKAEVKPSPGSRPYQRPRVESVIDEGEVPGYTTSEQVYQRPPTAHTTRHPEVQQHATSESGSDNTIRQCQSSQSTDQPHQYTGPSLFDYDQGDSQYIDPVVNQSERLSDASSGNTPPHSPRFEERDEESNAEEYEARQLDNRIRDFFRSQIPTTAVPNSVPNLGADRPLQAHDRIGDQNGQPVQRRSQLEPFSEWLAQWNAQREKRAAAHEALMKDLEDHDKWMEDALASYQASRDAYPKNSPYKSTRKIRVFRNIFRRGRVLHITTTMHETTRYIPARQVTQTTYRVKKRTRDYTRRHKDDRRTVWIGKRARKFPKPVNLEDPDIFVTLTDYMKMKIIWKMEDPERKQKYQELRDKSWDYRGRGPRYSVGIRLLDDTYNMSVISKIFEDYGWEDVDEGPPRYRYVAADISGHLDALPATGEYPPSALTVVHPLFRNDQQVLALATARPEDVDAKMGMSKHPIFKGGFDTNIFALSDEVRSRKMKQIAMIYQKRQEARGIITNNSRLMASSCGEARQPLPRAAVVYSRRNAARVINVIFGPWLSSAELAQRFLECFSPCQDTEQRPKRFFEIKLDKKSKAQAFEFLNALYYRRSNDNSMVDLFISRDSNPAKMSFPKDLAHRDLLGQVVQNYRISVAVSKTGTVYDDCTQRIGLAPEHRHLDERAVDKLLGSSLTSNKLRKTRKPTSKEAIDHGPLRPGFMASTTSLYSVPNASAVSMRSHAGEGASSSPDARGRRPSESTIGSAASPQLKGKGRPPSPKKSSSPSFLVKVGRMISGQKAPSPPSGVAKSSPVIKKHASLPKKRTPSFGEKLFGKSHANLQIGYQAAAAAAKAQQARSEAAKKPVPWPQPKKVQKGVAGAFGVVPEVGILKAAYVWNTFKPAQLPSRLDRPMFPKGSYFNRQINNPKIRRPTFSSAISSSGSNSSMSSASGQSRSFPEPQVPKTTWIGPIEANSAATGNQQTALVNKQSTFARLRAFTHKPSMSSPLAQSSFTAGDNVSAPKEGAELFSPKPQAPRRSGTGSGSTLGLGFMAADPMGVGFTPVVWSHPRALDDFGFVAGKTSKQEVPMALSAKRSAKERGREIRTAIKEKQRNRLAQQKVDGLALASFRGTTAQEVSEREQLMLAEHQQEMQSLIDQCQYDGAKKEILVWQQVHSSHDKKRNSSSADEPAKLSNIPQLQLAVLRGRHPAYSTGYQRERLIRLIKRNMSKVYEDSANATFLRHETLSRKEWKNIRRRTKGIVKRHELCERVAHQVAYVGHGRERKSKALLSREQSLAKITAIRVLQAKLKYVEKLHKPSDSLPGITIVRYLNQVQLDRLLQGPDFGIKSRQDALGLSKWFAWELRRIRTGHADRVVKDVSALTRNLHADAEKSRMDRNIKTRELAAVGPLIDFPGEKNKQIMRVYCPRSKSTRTIQLKQQLNDVMAPFACSMVIPYPSVMNQNSQSKKNWDEFIKRWYLDFNVSKKYKKQTIESMVEDRPEDPNREAVCVRFDISGKAFNTISPEDEPFPSEFSWTAPNRYSPLTERRLHLHTQRSELHSSNGWAYFKDPLIKATKWHQHSVSAEIGDPEPDDSMLNGCGSRCNREECPRAWNRDYGTKKLTFYLPTEAKLEGFKAMKAMRTLQIQAAAALGLDIDKIKHHHRLADWAETRNGLTRLKERMDEQTWFLPKNCSKGSSFDYGGKVPLPRLLVEYFGTRDLRVIEKKWPTRKLPKEIGM